MFRRAITDSRPKLGQRHASLMNGPLPVLIEHIEMHMGQPIHFALAQGAQLDAGIRPHHAGEVTPNGANPIWIATGFHIGDLAHGHAERRHTLIQNAGQAHEMREGGRGMDGEMHIGTTVETVASQRVNLQRPFPDRLALRGTFG